MLDALLRIDRTNIGVKAWAAAIILHIAIVLALMFWHAQGKTTVDTLGNSVTVMLVARGPAAASFSTAPASPPVPFADLMAQTPEPSRVLSEHRPSPKALEGLISGEASQATGAAEPQDTGYIDPYAHAATSFSDNLPSDLRKLLSRCWRKPALGKPVHVRFALSRDGDVRDVIILDDEVGATPDLVKAAAEKVIRDCGPYPAARGAHEYIVELN